ncbi:F0F1 ATP synthase subunit B [Candidatus Saccharibacteria bacterium]|nr:F0F1 ATP synthase subunit B [Candidatus Saccharibacteria bacterium]
MFKVTPQFAESASSGGISSLGINLKGFAFQLITFVIVLLILRRYVFPKLVATLEARRKTLEESLVQAKRTQEALDKAEASAAHILHQAREQADEALSEAKNQAKELVAKSEGTARDQAERIINETQEQIAQEHNKLRQELKRELAGLVAEASEKVLRAKLSSKEDERLINQSIKELN